MNIGKIHPIQLNEKTAYVIGAIIGDGHISNKTKSSKDKSPDYRISIELVNREYLSILYMFIKEIVNTSSKITKRKKSKKQQLYYLQFRNKSFHYFLTKTIGIPGGKKSSIVNVPEQIFTSITYQKWFLSGLFDTDGGIRGHTIGFTSASKELIDGVSRILDNLRIRHFQDNWTNKKYKKSYYGIRILKGSVNKFLNDLQILNLKKFDKITQVYRSGQTSQV